MKQYKRGIEAYQSASNGIKEVIKQPETLKNKEVKVEKNEGLIKTTKSDNKFEKVAKLLLLLGKKEASLVISHLPQDEIE